MPQFVKKPIQIEAIQFIGHAANDIAQPLFGGTTPPWLADALAADRDAPGSVHLFAHWEGPALQVRTLEGLMIAHARDWIIRGVEGEIYPCKPGIFTRTYDLIVED